jgi:hypothetical protein
LILAVALLLAINHIKKGVTISQNGYTKNKYLMIFKIILVLNIIVYLLTGIPEKIVIDINKSDNLDVSKIAEKIIVVPLKKDGIIPIGIVSINLIGNNLYVFQRYKEKESTTIQTNVNIFDLSGNYKGELIVKDPLSEKPLEIINMQCDEYNNRLFLSYRDGYRVFDSDGNFLYFKEKVLLKFFYKGLFWSVENSHKGEIADYSLVTTDLDGFKKDTVKSIKTKLPSNLVEAGVIPYTLPSFSIHSGELYISFGIDNTIYHVNQKTLIPVYRFEFKNRPRSEYDIFGAPSQLIFGRYIKYGIRINGKQGDAFYDIKDKKSLYIKYLGNPNDLDSGINDDINNTGYFQINLTNNENYIYFVKGKHAFKGGEINEKNKLNVVVFLVKLK